LHYLNISLSAFRIAGGIILLMVALDMLANKRQARREQGNHAISTDDNIAIFPLATPLLAGPAAITSVMVVASSPTGNRLWRNGCGDAGDSNRFDYCQPC
jgi:multiple antibiotic resistance protein